MKALVFSSYTNAYAIYKSAKFVGMDCHTTDEHPIFPIPANHNATQADWLFFTEEASLRRALTGEFKGNYFPEQFPLDLLDDKWAFVDWLRQQESLTKGLQQWALSDREQAIFPCLFKAKHSWAGTTKLPRGWVCHSRQEVEHYLDVLEQQRLEENHFFLQEWLGELKCRVISVCGFYDAKNNRRNLTAIVERIASHTEGLSCSAAVQTIGDDWGLVEKTSGILNALFFTGPYEMEFLVMEKRVAVLELNPRFWMQHAIFLKHGNGLIKRYCGMETPEDWALNRIENTVWIDGVHLVFSIFRLKADFLSLVIRKLFADGEKPIIWPSLPVAAYIVGRIGMHKLRRVLGQR